MKQTYNSKIWTPIKGFEGCYLVSKLGLIKSLHTTNKKGNIAFRIDRAGYITVRLSLNGKTHSKYLHRILAEAFIPNPDDKPEINHIDGNKLNNSISNLEFVTHAENMQHAYKMGLIVKKLKAVIDLCTGMVFKSSKEAAISTGINQYTLKGYLNGRIKKNPTCLKYAA